MRLSSRPIPVLARFRRQAQGQPRPRPNISPCTPNTRCSARTTPPQAQINTGWPICARLTRLWPAADQSTFCYVQRRGPPPAPPPLRHRPPEPAPAVVPGQPPSSTPPPTLSSTPQSIFTSSVPPIRCASHPTHVQPACSAPLPAAQRVVVCVWYFSLFYLYIR